jgi:hypothetical protein
MVIQELNLIKIEKWFPGTTIAGLSVGAERSFKIDFPNYSNLSPLEIKLFHGSLYVMEPPTNDHCYHSIPLDPSVSQIRYSFTFRDINQEDFQKMPIIPIVRCVAELKSGKRQGQPCDNIVKGKEIYVENTVNNLLHYKSL